MNVLRMLEEQPVPVRRLRAVKKYINAQTYFLVCTDSGQAASPNWVKQGHNHRRQTKGSLRHGKRGTGRKKNLKGFPGLLARHPKFERKQHQKRAGPSQISDRRQNMAQRRASSVALRIVM
jgi:hypothetical protein